MECFCKKSKTTYKIVCFIRPTLHRYCKFNCSESQPTYQSETNWETTCCWVEVLHFRQCVILQTRRIISVTIKNFKHFATLQTMIKEVLKSIYKKVCCIIQCGTKKKSGCANLSYSLFASLSQKSLSFREKRLFHVNIEVFYSCMVTK